MKFAVYATPFRTEIVAGDVRAFVNSLVEGGHDVVLAENTLNAFREYGIEFVVSGAISTAGEAKLDTDVDFVVSLGGDGTFLRAAHWSVEHPVPIVGVNLGHLGYLTAFSDEELFLLPGILSSGDFDIEHRAMLQVLVDGVGSHGDDKILCALNEVAILKQDTASMISIPVAMNGHELGTYNADGLIVSTPTGSTAYNLSVGGPVLQPTAGVWVLSPIADHSLTMRPMVVSDTNVIVMTAEGRASSFRVSLDGKSFVLPTGTPVTVSKAPFRCLMVCKKGSMFASTLRSKLLWGKTPK